MLTITNEQIVDEIRKGHSVKENLGLLYEMNLPLIEKIIKPYTAYECEADLLQESYFGLLEAAKRYEASENVRFMTYAAWWIRSAVQKYIEKCGSVVRIPSHMRQKMMRLKKTVEELGQEYGCTPTDTEIAARMGVSLDDVQRSKSYLQGAASLDAPPPEDDSLSYLDAIQDDFCLEDEVVDKMYAAHSKAELWGVLERYASDKESKILKEIFIHGKSMAQIAREEDVGRECVRQIKEKGLRRLRTGRAKRELLEKFDIAEAGAYRGNWSNFKEHDSSIVEYIVERKLEAEGRYEQHLREIGEMHRNRLARKPERGDYAETDTA